MNKKFEELIENAIKDFFGELEKLGENKPTESTLTQFALKIILLGYQEGSRVGFDLGFEMKDNIVDIIYNQGLGAMKTIVCDIMSLSEEDREKYFGDKDVSKILMGKISDIKVGHNKWCDVEENSRMIGGLV